MSTPRQAEQHETVIQPRKADVTWFSKWNWIFLAVLFVAAIPVAWHVITTHQPATLAVAACLLLSWIGYWCFSMGWSKLPPSRVPDAMPKTTRLGTFVSTTSTRIQASKTFSVLPDLWSTEQTRKSS